METQSLLEHTFAEYNALQMVHGYDSSDMDRYDAIRLNERVIGRAIDDAEENDNGQKILGNNWRIQGEILLS